MKERKLKDVAASIRRRLSNAAQASGRPFQELVQYFAMERFLYRLSHSKHADRFVLKGALMLTVWRVSSSRPTKDIDLLGRMPNNIEAVANAIRDACVQQVDPDGLTFDSDTVEGRVIKEDADYEGVRVTFRGSLQNMPLAMQIDVGFGDVVFPQPTLAEYPTILDHDPPKLQAYSREAAIAEKFEAMVKLGQLNSRMKDFYDVWQLSQQFDFDGATLASAIEKTFAHRGTAIPANPTAFTAEFASDSTKAKQWQGFLRKSRLQDAPMELKVVVDQIASFLSPLAAALNAGKSFNRTWRHPGPWN